LLADWREFLQKTAKQTKVAIGFGTLGDLRFLLLKFPLSPAALLADPTAFFTEGNEKNKGRSWICKPFVIFVSFC